MIHIKKLLLFGVLVLSFGLVACSDTESHSSESDSDSLSDVSSVSGKDTSSSINSGRSIDSSQLDKSVTQTDSSRGENSSKKESENTVSSSDNKKTNDNTVSQAEAIAKMIVDNEKVWHETDRLSDMFKESDISIFDPPATSCWFEDVDFDGKREFIVGPIHIEPGLTLACSYEVYDVSDGKLNKRNFNNSNSNNTSFLFEKQNKIDKLKFKSNNIGMFLYKDNKNKYHYLYSGFSMYDVSQALNYTSFDSWGKNASLMFSYYFESLNTNEGEFKVGSEQVSLNVLISKLEEFIKSTKQCTVNSKQVNLTDKSGKITSDCYSKKTKEEKIKSLAESYNAYKIVESDKQPDFLVYMLKRLEEKMPKKADESKLSDDEKRYKQALDSYKNSIAAGQVFGFGNEPINNNEIGYAFCDLNNDGVNELLIIPTNANEKTNRRAISDIYSIVNGKPKQLLFSGMIGSSISIKQDNSIIRYERFSAFSGWYEKYNSIKTLLASGDADERLDYDSTVGPPTYKYTVGGKERTIGGDEFQSIQAKWMDKSRSFNIKLFSEYK